MSSAYFAREKLVETTPTDATEPPMVEVGLTSAPLKSASFFIPQFCGKYNDDFMLCKNENNDPEHCLKEGRKVTRCAMDLFSKLKENCGKEFESHWQCLDNNNQEYFYCRKQEKALNKCVFEKLGLNKTIPDIPKGTVPVHEKENPMFKA